MMSIKSHIHHINKRRQVDRLTDHLLTNTNYEDIAYSLTSSMVLKTFSLDLFVDLLLPCSSLLLMEYRN